MANFPALEAFLAKDGVVDIQSAQPEIIKEVQTILNLTVDGLAGKQTLYAFARFKAERGQGQPLLLGSGGAKLLLEYANRPAISNNADVQRQCDRLSTYLQSGAVLNLNAKTKYFGQRDNYTQPHRTCNSSAHAMYVDWLLRMTGKAGLDSDDGYLRKVIAIGDSIYHEVHTNVIKQYGFSTKWNVDADRDFVFALLDAGFPVPCNILHRGSRSRPTGGHIIMLIGRKEGSIIAHDPYGTLTSGYSDMNGAYSRISEGEWRDRWQGGYRILA